MYTEDTDRSRPKASVSVFFALSFTLIISVFLLLCESVRMQHTRWYLTQTVNSAVDSLFSQYHRKLWNDYRILGLEYYSTKQLQDEIYAFEKPYLETKDWFCADLTESVEILGMNKLTDEEGRFFEKEILDYMKYGIAATIADEADLRSTAGLSLESMEIDGISGLYSEHTEEALILENRLKKICDALDQHRHYYNNALASLDSCDGNSFIDNAECMIEELDKLPGLIEEYKTAADLLFEKLEGSRQEAEEKLSKNLISKEHYLILERDMEEYESYCSADGERRREIENLVTEAGSARSFIEMLIAQAEDIMAYISDWEPADEDDELDEEALWEPVTDQLNGYIPLSLSFHKGVEDRESEGALKKVKRLIEGELLKLVLPEGTKLSSKTLELNKCPSEKYPSLSNCTAAGIADSMYVIEYILDRMNYFGKKDAGNGSVYEGTAHAETEYILYGKKNDEENLAAAVKELAAIRSGLNIIFLYRDSSRYSEARMLASAITGITGFAPLTSLICFFILTLWASAQAVLDVRDLLCGKKVPLIHNSTSFSLTLDGLKDFAKGNFPETASSDSGLLYSDYLKLLLFMKYGSAQILRCMDIIQMNIQRTQPDFLLERCICSLDTGTSFSLKHVLIPSVLSGNMINKKNAVNILSSYSY